MFIGPKSDHCLALTVDTISLTPVVETINDVTLAVKDASAKVVDIFVIDRLVTVDKSLITACHSLANLCNLVKTRELVCSRLVWAPTLAKVLNSTDPTQLFILKKNILL